MGTSVQGCIFQESHDDITIFPLTINMHLLHNWDLMLLEEQREAEDFSDFLLRVGEGLMDKTPDGLLTLPEECCTSPSKNGIDSIYPGLKTLPPTDNIRSE